MKENLLGSAGSGRLLAVALGLTSGLASSLVRADVVTDWNEVTILAAKGFDGSAGNGLALDTNLTTRIAAIEARAVFDAINAIEAFSAESYSYRASHAGSPEAAAAQAAHDVLAGELPDPAADASVDPKWSATRAWLDARLQSDLSAWGVSASDEGIAVGKAAAAAALAARKLDNARPVTSYGAQLTAQSNPGIGLWRQVNSGAPYVNPTTGAPTGFDAAGTTIQGRPGIDLNWRDVNPFSLSTRQKNALVAAVPLSPAVGSAEYAAELDYLRTRGRDTSNVRTADQTAQALYYRQDAEIFINEAARIASAARGLSLQENAALFALLDNALADVRFAAFSSKYDQKFWRPITALNADADGTVTNGYAAWHPLAATPSHPSNTAGHSSTGAAGFEILRAYFKSDQIRPDGAPVTLGSIAWLAGTNNGTGNASTRTVRSFSQVQLENGASRLYLGVHFGYDNLQGQLLGLAVAEEILLHSDDPAAAGVRPKPSPASRAEVVRTLLARPDLYGFFGRSTSRPER